MEHEHFGRDFENWWKEIPLEGWEGYKWMKRLQRIKTHLKRWNSEVFGDMRLIEGGMYNRLKELDRLETDENWNEELREERVNLKKELHDIMVKKEIMTRQKLRVQWAKEGDANSRLFHRLLRALIGSLFHCS